MPKAVTILIGLLLLVNVSVFAQSESQSLYNTSFLDDFKLLPVGEVRAQDTPDDNGGSITLNWDLSPDDRLMGSQGYVERYLLGRRKADDGNYEYIVSTGFKVGGLFDFNVKNYVDYEYVVGAYPFKNIFSPPPWGRFFFVSHLDRIEMLAPMISLNPVGCMLTLSTHSYGYYKKLDGFQSPLYNQSIWENVYRGPRLSGPDGINPDQLVGQMISPAGTILQLFVNSASDGDPYNLVAVGEILGQEMLVVSASTQPVKATQQWFNKSRFNIFIATVILIFLILYYIRQARSGKELFIRRIAGLEAVDEAVGRATEMGKEIFFVPGTQDMQNIQTIAGVIILGRVARLAAQYETRLEVPVSRSLVMVTAREIVKEAYMNVGRPDAFSEDQVHYLTDDQFGYAAAIDGKMVRQKPATVFYMGAFYAESLILAETGNSIGAVQIAGTAMPAQLPFFVAACDYTLIGEELFAASAYLSREPKLLGSLKGQDIGKALILILLAIGVIVQTFGWFDFKVLFKV